MSGPKDNRAEIERRRREELERQRKKEEERRRKVNALRNKVNSGIMKAQNDLSFFENKIDALCATLKALGLPKSESLSRLNNDLKSYRKSLQSRKNDSSTENEKVLNDSISFMQKLCTQINSHEKELSLLSNIINKKASILQKVNSLESIGAKLDKGAKSIKEYALKLQVNVPDAVNISYAQKARNLKAKTDLTTENLKELDSIIQKIEDELSKTSSIEAAISKSENEVKNSYTDKVMNEISNISKEIYEQEALRGKELSRDEKSEQDAIDKELENCRKAEKRENILKQGRELFEQIDKNVDVPASVKEKISALKLSLNEKADSDADYLSDFFSICVIPEVKKIEKEISSYHELLERFIDTQIEYETICQEVNEDIRTYAVCSDSIVYMQSEIQRLRAIAQCRNEERYTQQALEEVMAQMGYKVLGKAKNIESGYINHALYRFDEHTALSVTTDDNGDICMELGGMDDNDRDPDMAEAAALKSDMEFFCQKHKEIKEKLKEKGVILHTMHELPPEVEYAQIFNLNDYEIEEETQKEIIERQHRQQNIAQTEQKSKHLD